MPLATAGEDSMLPPVAAVHFVVSCDTLAVPITDSSVLSPVCARSRWNMGQPSETYPASVVPGEVWVLLEPTLSMTVLPARMSCVIVTDHDPSTTFFALCAGSGPESS